MQCVEKDQKVVICSHQYRERQPSWKVKILSSENTKFDTECNIMGGPKGGFGELLRERGLSMGSFAPVCRLSSQMFG